MESSRVSLIHFVKNSFLLVPILFLCWTPQRYLGQSSWTPTEQLQTLPRLPNTSSTCMLTTMWKLSRKTLMVWGVVGCFCKLLLRRFQASSCSHHQVGGSVSVSPNEAGSLHRTWSLWMDLRRPRTLHLITKAGCRSAVLTMFISNCSLCVSNWACVPEGDLHVTIKAYKAEQKDEISLELGETIEVIHKLLDGWWVVRYRSPTSATADKSWWSRVGDEEQN